MIYYDLYHPKVEVFSSPTTVTLTVRHYRSMGFLNSFASRPLSRYALFNAYK